MGLLEFLKPHNINQGIEEFRSVPGSVLIDVRGRQEYSDGHIPGAVNIPVESIAKASEIINDMDTPVYIYCYSGRRSSMAAGALKKMGYSNVKNIGGIVSYKGQLDR